MENSKNNSFRQHITDVKKHLLEELHPDKNGTEQKDNNSFESESPDEKPAEPSRC